MARSEKGDAWYAIFDSLPEDRKQKMRGWFKRQELIVETLGISNDKWFEYIAWGIEHPHDEDFLKGLDVSGSQEPVGDSVGVAGAEMRARKSIGGAVSRPAAPARPVSERAKGNELDRDLLAKMLRTGKKG